MISADGVLISRYCKDTSCLQMLLRTIWFTTDLKLDQRLLHCCLYMLKMLYFVMDFGLKIDYGFIYNGLYFLCDVFLN